jgi:hypothetical protein
VAQTLVVSDLHLGARRGTDVLRRPGPLAALCARLESVDRLVLLGDAIELRHGPARDALAVAEPVLRACGSALGPGGEIVLVAGNHDHALVAPWLRARGARRQPAPLALDEAAGPRAAGPALRRLITAAAPATLTVRYPGVWLREDVYATHGHYLDCLTTLPAFERLGAGIMARIEGPVPASGALPDDFEARLAPMYAWLDALAESRGGRWSEEKQGASASAWELLSSSGTQPLKARVLAGLFPLGILGLNRVGIGPLKAELSGEALRDAGLAAMGDVLTRLGVGAPHVIFGHTHRAGPLPTDDLGPWRVGGGTQLHNSGCWLDEAILTRGGPDSPYWAGRGVELDDTGPPRLVRIVEDLGTAA